MTPDPRSLLAREALIVSRESRLNNWNRSPTSSALIENLLDASRRIFDGFASVEPQYAGPKLQRDAAIFTMGSCFAREIEAALSKRRGNVVSIGPELTSNPAFIDSDGRLRT